MPANIKSRAFTFLLMAVILTALIAAALPQLEVRPGIPLPASEVRADTPIHNQAHVATVSSKTYFKAALEITLILVMAAGIYKLLKGVHWKEILVPTLLLAVLGMVISYVLFGAAGVQIKSEPLAEETLPPDLHFAGPPLGHLPTWLIWLVWIGLAIGVILLGIWFIRQPGQNTQHGDPLLLEAERALQALRSGSHLNNVIVRCYEQMGQALLQERKIELEQTMTEQTMTAREFEHLLETRGIPSVPVHQLTQLFEAARYGFREPGPEDVQKAFECLNAIVQFSRTEGKPD
jgi:hypothetical protein